MNITDGEYALSLRNFDNVEQANRTIESLDRDVLLLRQKLAAVEAKLTLEQVHSAALESQLEVVASAIPEGTGIRALSGKKWADGKPVNKLAETYVLTFDRKAREANLGDPSRLRRKLQGE